MLPLPSSAEATRNHLDRKTTVTVTASPRLGIEETVRTCEELARDGFRAVPHLAARLVHDEAQLRAILVRLGASGLEEAFVIGGDGQPVGDYADALSLMHAMSSLAERGDAPVPSRLGVAAYPEGHPRVSDADLWQALLAKQPLASYAVTQMCFDPAAITAYVANARRTGVTLPFYAGIPGRLDRRRLLRISRRIGVGDSARFLRKHRHVLLRVVLPRAFGPDRLLRGLSRALAEPDTDHGLTGLHLYTLGDVVATEAWRRDLAGRPSLGRSR